MSLRGIHHLAIQVRDLAAAERFYNGLLGLPVVKRWPWPDGRPGERSVWLELDPAGTFLALEACEGEREPQGFRDKRPGLHLGALRIASFERDSWEQKLAAAGVPIEHRTAYTLYVQDPEGN